MSAAEKLAAEWEARHDVAARGRRPGPETVPHYLAHERLVHQRPADARATGATASRQARRPSVPDEPAAPAQVPAPRTGGLLRRLFTRQH